MKKLLLVFLIEGVGILVSCLSLLIGWWLITLLIGLAIGLMVDKRGMAFLMVCCMGGLSWGLSLCLLAMSAPVEKVATAVESIIGVSSLHGVAILLTVVLGCLLCIAGWWVGVAYRGLSIALGLPRLQWSFLARYRSQH
ncbi:MAG TPA: hypothetical protein VFN35_13020 [Ktedonobacteraceae bacterium]|nr:hypothetical protein [Ktedonobacteraceae bacterium]